MKHFSKQKNQNIFDFYDKSIVNIFEVSMKTKISFVKVN